MVLLGFVAIFILVTVLLTCIFLVLNQMTVSVSVSLFSLLVDVVAAVLFLSVFGEFAFVHGLTLSAATSFVVAAAFTSKRDSYIYKQNQREQWLHQSFYKIPFNSLIIFNICTNNSINDFIVKETILNIYFQFYEKTTPKAIS